MKAIIIVRLLFCISALTISILSYSQDAYFSYTYPLAGSDNLNPEQNIILKYPWGVDPGSVSLDDIIESGSKSGLMTCKYLISNDQKTIIFKPTLPYKPGEKVKVKYSGGMTTATGLKLHNFEFDFNIIDHDREKLYGRRCDASLLDQKQFAPGAADQLKIVSQKDNNLPPDYPAPTVYSYGDHDHEYIFINVRCRNSSQPWKRYLTILDAYGTPIYYDKSVKNRSNFSLLSNGMLSYCLNTSPNSQQEKYYIMDSSYIVVDSVNTGNGYILDAHDMLLLGNGNYLVMSYDPQPVDMSEVVPGGNPGAIVTGLVIQEVDNAENVYFQWRSWDHFEITDATYDIDLTASQIDYVHGNAFEIDFDGNILLSSRHLDEITKIDFTTGDILWRFGLNSENNMFAINNDPYGFTHQHDIRKLTNGNYTLYDNGNLRNPQYTQVLEYEIDEATLTAKLVWDYHHTPQVYAGSAGSFRTQPNGERIIGWGGTWPLAVTELKDDNNLLREFYLPDYVTIYRAFKSTWETNVFKTRAELSLGNYAGYNDWKPNRLYIFNTSGTVVSITSIPHHLPEFEILTELPIAIFPDTYKSIEIGFNPSNAGDYIDRFTLNFDNPGNTRRIARQVEIHGYYIDESPSVFFIPSYNSNNVSPATEITINFDEPVQKALGGDIQNEDIPYLIELKETFYKGTEILFSGTINEEKTQIIIIPDQILMENQQYYIKLKGGLIIDYDEHTIKLDEESYFTTGTMLEMPENSVGRVQVYPIPFNEEFIIVNPQKRNNNIQIFDICGQLIYNAQSLNPKLRVNLSDQASGLYFVRISNSTLEEPITTKIIKY